MTVPADNNNPAANHGLWSRLTKTRALFNEGLRGLFNSNSTDENWLDDLQDQLLLADVGVSVSEKIIKQLREQIKSEHTPAQLSESLRQLLTEILAPCEKKLEVSSPVPFVIMAVGVNGVGKTTTVAKLAARFKNEGRSVMLAACDTFRAAAIPQLQSWGEKLDLPVIAAAAGADPAAVAHDAYHSACARKIEVLIIDTAGRQHTQSSLMAQLGKIQRILKKIDADIPNEVLLVLDGSSGSNSVSQTTQFRNDCGVSGLCITKLDGTAKGGVVVALAEQFALPIRYIGVGENEEDLREFAAAEFAAALLPSADE